MAASRRRRRTVRGKERVPQYDLDMIHSTTASNGYVLCPGCGYTVRWDPDQRGYLNYNSGSVCIPNPLVPNNGYTHYDHLLVPLDLEEPEYPLPPTLPELKGHAHS